ncbi:hypothetical protein Tco_1378128 [Tanacetum coccineum]
MVSSPRIGPKIKKKTSGSDGLTANISRSEDKFFSDDVVTESSDSGTSQGGSAKKTLDKHLFYSFNDGENGGTNVVLNDLEVTEKLELTETDGKCADGLVKDGAVDPTPEPIHVSQLQEAETIEAIKAAEENVEESLTSEIINEEAKDSEIIMANLPPNHNEFAPAAEVAPDNMNEEEMDADEEWDGPEWILPYQGADPLYPPPLASDSESEIKFEEAEAEVEAEAEAEVAPIPPPPVLANPEPEAVTVGTGRLTPLKRLFTDTQVWIGSSSSSADVGHDLEDPTLSHIRSDLDALHRWDRQIENDDVRAENKRLRMMLDCSENRTRDAWRELDRATWHYHHLRRWSITVKNLLPPRL